ncbi:hypothetical protein KSS87_007780 [Heliosperma pusillum]|nr:hypothetical protein KSS87_007780 [Heliosperma pusillum]
MYGKRNSKEFQKGVEEFCRSDLEYATTTNDEGFYCPCVDCSNVTKVDSIKLLREHIICRGFRQDYHIWIWHGEEGVYRRNSNINDHFSEQLVENENLIQTEHHLQQELETSLEIDEDNLNKGNGVDLDEENIDDDGDEDDDQLHEMLDGVEDQIHEYDDFEDIPPFSNPKNNVNDIGDLDTIYTRSDHREGFIVDELLSIMANIDDPVHIADDDYDHLKDRSYNVDASYNPELEDDIDEVEDQDEMEEDRRMDEYELMADAAALRGLEIVKPITLSALLKTPIVSKQGKGSCKGRSATKGFRNSDEPMKLEFDKYNRPIGKWQGNYGKQIGFCMRKLNINWNWKDVSAGKRKLLWQNTMLFFFKTLFHIPDDDEILKKNFLSAVAKRFRDFKGKLVSGWITKTRERTKGEDRREPHEIWKHINIEDWKLFLQIKNSSPAKRKREKAIECAKKNNHHHHLGQKSYTTVRPTWIKDGFYPECTFVSTSTPVSAETTSIVTVEPNRADDWFCSMHIKDKETGKYVIIEPKTKEVAEKYLELRRKQAKGEFVPNRNQDALYYAFGEKDDHPSRARGFGGVNVTLKRAFGAAAKTSRSRKSETLLEDREALKNELREELKNEMQCAVRSSVSLVLQEMGLSTLKQPDDISAHGADQINLNNVEIDTSLALILKDPHSGVTYEVARGKAFPGELCHQGYVGSDQLRVKVTIVPQEFETLPLPIPVSAYDLNILKDAIGSIVLWPLALVRVENEKDTRPSQLEVMGSNSHHSKLSITPTKAPTEEPMVESLSSDCQWLNVLVGTMVDGETYNIYLDVDLFYYNIDGKTVIYKDDLRKFLEGCELNISIIQVFIRALRDDLVKTVTQPRIGWLCPDATSDAKLIKKAEIAIAYIANAFQKSVHNGHEFIMAPIIDSALKRYKMSGGEIKVKRKEPLWKSIKCPRQNGCLESGYFVLRFMYDIVKNCTTISDLEKVFNSQGEELLYTNCEINEVRDTWASYFTSQYGDKTLGTIKDYLALNPMVLLMEKRLIFYDSLPIPHFARWFGNCGTTSQGIEINYASLFCLRWEDASRHLCKQEKLIGVEQSCPELGQDVTVSRPDLDLGVTISRLVLRQEVNPSRPNLAPVVGEGSIHSWNDDDFVEADRVSSTGSDQNREEEVLEEVKVAQDGSHESCGSRLKVRRVDKGRWGRGSEDSSTSVVAAKKKKSSKDTSWIITDLVPVGPLLKLPMSGKKTHVYRGGDILVEATANALLDQFAIARRVEDDAEQLHLFRRMMKDVGPLIDHRLARRKPTKGPTTGNRVQCESDGRYDDSYKD